MSFRGYILTVFALVFAGALLAQAVRQGVFQAPESATPQQSATPPAAEKTPVDIKADKSNFDKELNARLGLDERAMFLVGDVVFHHNGAVISCDSAVQYSSRHIECFNNVIINKDSTFVYADRAEYNGDLNLAKVFSPVIKVVDGSSTLYTYNFEFNTLEDVGRWYGGGVIYQEGNTLESERGYYFSNLRELVAVQAVQMKNESHQLVGDSVRYNTLTKIATFYTPTTIWTNNGEIIDARQGWYSTADSTYFFHDNAYILTPEREVWADTVDYSALTGHALLLGNAQVNDNDPSADSGSGTSAWGDWMEYWDKPFVDTLTGIRREKGEAMLTRRPVIANYDAEQNADTLYIRADTFFMSIAYRHLPKKDTVEVDAIADSVLRQARQPVDSLVADSLPVAVRDLSWRDTLSRKELKALEKQERVVTRDRARAVKDSLRSVRLALKAEARAAKQAEKTAARALKEAAKRARKGLMPLFDSVAFRRDSLMRADSLFRVDSIATKRIVDSLAAAKPKAAAAEPDTVLRTFKGWHNVKIWRVDFSAVADSLIGFSADSTVHLYKDPLLWHGDNQIDSDSITIWSANQKISRAEFYGSPIMSMQVDPDRYNQVKGRVMTSYFRDNAIYRHDAVGNAEAVYYMQEDAPADTTVVFDPSPIAFVALTASEMSFLIDSQTVRYIVPRSDVRSTVYPMDQIPMSEPTRLQGFAWYGDRRPALSDVFSRTWRASRREEFAARPRPEFPIAARIDRRREYLIFHRMWAERSEPLPAHAAEFREERYFP